MPVETSSPVCGHRKTMMPIGTPPSPYCTAAKNRPGLTNDALVRQFSAWLAGIQYEIDFWEQWTANKGDRWPEDFASRLDPNRETNPALFEGLSVQTPKVLDVGAGPMSIFGLK